VHPSESRYEKLERYVIEAAKQCGRNVLMRIEPLQPFEDLLRRPDLPARRLLADPSGQSFNSNSPLTDTLLVLGPEGGFSDEELKAAKDAGWQLVSLGNRILRIETAALALTALVANAKASA
jgi:16S rRNA (uracil1498-N3)-methyltransferase